jgi:hypothetical protein
MTYAAESYAQKTMISLEVRNETVGTVLEKLKKESGFDFFFNNKHVDLKRIVSVSANNNNIFKILDQIFAGTNVKYSVLEKKIILSTEIVQGIQQEQNKVTGIGYRHSLEVVNLASAQDGRQNLMLLGSGEDEDDMLRWLFQRLEKGVEGGCREHVDLIDDKHLILAYLRRNAGLFH